VATASKAKVSRGEVSGPLRRLLGLAMVVFGALTLGIVALLMSQAENKNSTFFQFSAGNGSTFSQLSMSQPMFQPGTLKAWFFVASVVMLAGVFVASKRFTLKGMLVGAVACGGLNLIPAGRAQRTSAPVVTMDVTLPKGLESARLSRINAALQPARAMATLPPETIKSLGIATETAVTYVNVTFQYNRMSRMTVSLSPELPAAQQRLLMQFFAEYFEMLVHEEAKAQGIAITPGGMVSGMTLPMSDWPNWRAAWLAKLPQNK
jgi:hypothetical protein